MTNEINLLIPDKGKDLQAQHRARIMRSISFVMLFSVSTIAIVMAIFIALSPLPALKKDEAQSLAQIAVYHPQMIKLALLNSRLDQISHILSTRSSHDKTIALLRQEMPVGISIQSLQLDTKDVLLVLESNSLQSLDGFLSNVKSYQDAHKAFAKITLNTLAYQPDKSTYALSLSITLL